MEINEYDVRNILKITNGKALQDFRFFAPMERTNAIVFGVVITGNVQELCECKLENPDLGKVDIVPLDYPKHAKRRTYICDVLSMFDDRFGAVFFRKENENQHLEEVRYAEQISPFAFVVHEGLEIVD